MDGSGSIGSLLGEGACLRLDSLTAACADITGRSAVCPTTLAFAVLC